MPLTIEELTRDRFDDAVEVLCDAFFDYPVMHYVIGETGDDYPRRLRRLVSFFTIARFLRQDLVWGLTDGSEIFAVANIVPPADIDSPEALAEHRRSLWEDLGEDARARYEAHGSATADFEWAEPHFHLSMLGVGSDHAGRGHGRRLLDALHATSASDPDSVGVSLTTETPENVPLYEHFGYRVVGHERVGDLETWGLFRLDGND